MLSYCPNNANNLNSAKEVSKRCNPLLTTHLTNQRLVNLRNVLNYELTPKNNVFAMVVLFIAIIIPVFP